MKERVGLLGGGFEAVEVCQAVGVFGQGVGVAEVAEHAQKDLALGGGREQERVRADPLSGDALDQSQRIVFGHELAAIEDIDEHLRRPCCG